MYIRCASCKYPTWIHASEAVASSLSTTCGACGRVYRLEPARKLGATSREQYERALLFGEANEIDLPSAYSVLLGILSLDEARADHDRAAQRTPETRAATARDGKEVEITFDAGFERAVAEGHLTPVQAMERGEREAWASRVASRHDLPLDLAKMVADNRLALRDAIRWKTSPAEPPQVEQPPRPRRPVGAALVICSMIAIAGVIGHQAWRSWFPPVDGNSIVTTDETLAREADHGRSTEGADPVEKRRVGSAVVHADGEGRAYSIEGPDPRAVLIAYCRSGPRAANLEPVDLGPVDPPSPSTLLGLFKDSGDPHSLHAIRIHRDRRKRCWVAGSGNEPIEAVSRPIPPPSPSG